MFSAFLTASSVLLIFKLNILLSLVLIDICEVMGMLDHLYTLKYCLLCHFFSFSFPDFLLTYLIFPSSCILLHPLPLSTFSPFLKDSASRLMWMITKFVPVTPNSL